MSRVTELLESGGKGENWGEGGDEAALKLADGGVSTGQASLQLLLPWSRVHAPDDVSNISHGATDSLDVEVVVKLEARSVVTNRP